MPIISQVEHVVTAVLVCILVRMVWKHHDRRLRKLWEKVKAGRPRRWRAKSPHDCLACQEARQCVSLTAVRVSQEVPPWSEIKSTRGRKKRVETRGFTCPRASCKYFGKTDLEVHSLVGYGKCGKHHDIQTLKCQACGCVFSCRRNAPLYYIKTAWDRVEIVLWLLAEGVDVSVLVRYTGHVDA